MKKIVLTFALLVGLSATAEAGGPWSDQYCDIETTTIRVVDQNGKCEFYTWPMPLGETEVIQRSIACKRLDGKGYEIVQGYHNFE